MSNLSVNTVPSVMPIGSGAIVPAAFAAPLSTSAFGAVGGYACADLRGDLVFGRVRATATAMKQHPGTQVWSPPS